MSVPRSGMPSSSVRRAGRKSSRLLPHPATREEPRMGVPPAARESDHRPCFWVNSASGVRIRFYEVTGGGRTSSLDLRRRFGAPRRPDGCERSSS